MIELFANAPLFALIVMGSSYLFGSIPFGLILSKVFNLGDLRAIGSGNIGATNVLRTGNKKVAALTLVLDMVKGFLPAFLFIGYDPFAGVLAAIFAVLGHCHPIWLKFKGGKGVATFLGVLLGLNLFAGLAVAATWLFVAVISRYSSLSALIASLLAPAYIVLFGKSMGFAFFVVLLTILIFWRHRTNIERLLKGDEPKIGQKKEATNA